LQLTAGSLSHRRVAQVDRQIGGAQPVLYQVFRQKAQQFHQGTQPQPLDMCPDIPLVPKLPADVQPELRPLGHAG